MAINLQSIRKGLQNVPLRMVIYGQDGVGKSHLAAGAPSPIFLDIEDGLSNIDVDAWKVTTFDEVMEAIAVLYDGGHEYKTIVLDSIDWLEKLVFAKVISDYNKTAERPAEVITDLAYGKGYALSIDYWNQLKDGLDALRNERGMHIVLIAHYKIAKMSPPDLLETYDKYTLDLNDKAAALFKEWCDIVLFLNFRVQTTVVKKDNMTKTKVHKAIGDNTVVGFFKDRPSAYAKSRFDLPEEVEIPKEGAFDLLLDAIKESRSTQTTKGD